MRPTFSQRRHLRRLAERQGVEVPIVRTHEARKAITRLEQRRRQGQLPGFREACA